MAAAIGLVGKLREMSLSMLRQSLSDWAQLAGATAELGEAKVQNLRQRSDVEAAIPGPCVLVETRFEGRCEGPCFFVFPVALAATAVGKLIMLPDAAIAAKAKAGLDATDVEAFREIANLLCGSSNNVIARSAPGLRLSQSVKALRVAVAAPTIKARIEDLPNAEIACIEAAVRVDGNPFTLYQLLPLALARSVLS